MIMKKLFTVMILSASVLTACKNNDDQFDAAGTFEATDEVIVSSELPGKLISFTVEEGASIAKDSIVGSIDALNVSLQKEQVEASIQALNQKTANVEPQVK